MVDTDFAKGTLDAKFHLPKGEKADHAAARVVQPSVYPLPAVLEITLERGCPTAELKQDQVLSTAILQVTKTAETPGISPEELFE